MKFVIFLIVCSVFATNFVESGIIIDNLKTGVSTTRNTIRCGVHKIGGLISRKNVNCIESNETGKDDRTEETTHKHETTKDDKVTNQKTTKKLLSATEKILSSTEASLSSSEKTAVTVQGGRRVISVGSNCPEGFRGDGQGNCREEY